MTALHFNGTDYDIGFCVSPSSRRLRAAAIENKFALRSIIRIVDSVEDTSPQQLQINLHCARLIRTLADAEDTPPRQSQINLHCARLIRIFGCAEDTPARQCSNKFDIALAYSYLCMS